MRTSCLLFLATLGLVACDCSSSTLPDAPDVPVQDTPRDVDALPEIVPTSPSCDDATTPEGAVCVEHGWFSMGRWNTVTHWRGTTEAPEGRLPVPRQPVFLESFALDETEVSLAAYESFVESSGAEPLPSECGYEAQNLLSADIEPRFFVPELAETEPTHPVVCVTRSEARSFCRARGGRLPTAAEWMKASPEPYPSFRRFPWGNSPPEPTASAAEWGAILPIFLADYAVFGEPQPVGTRLEGAGPTGALDLAGSVSELLADCREDLAAYGDGSEPLVRPALPTRELCTEALLIAGSNWRNFNEFESAGAASIWSYRDGNPENEMYSPDDGVEGLDALMESAVYGLFGAARPREGTPADGAGNLRRSWRVGFRCAYDL